MEHLSVHTRRLAAALALAALMLLALPGCGDRGPAGPAGAGTSWSGGDTGVDPGPSGPAAPDSQEGGQDAAPQERGEVKRFRSGDMTVEISNVKEVQRGTSVLGEDETWEYDIYVVYPGATARVIAAGASTDEETGLPHAEWAFYAADDSRTDILDGMEPLAIDGDVLGIISKEASVYVLGFQVDGGPS